MKHTDLILRATTRGVPAICRNGEVRWPSRPHYVLPRKASSAIFSSAVWHQIARNLGLSARELEIVRGTFDDQTEASIANSLQIAASTVHTHVERLHYKLAVADRAQLILRVFQEFLSFTACPREARFNSVAIPGPCRRKWRHLR